MDSQSHWERIYSEKAPNAVSWYRPHLEKSISLIEQFAPGKVGGERRCGRRGSPTLVDDASRAGI